MAEITQVNKYNKSKIYKICSNLTDKIYVGSTTQTLAQRLSEHVSHYKQYVRNNERYVTSYEIIMLNDYYIALIEEHNFNNRQQLERREGEIIKLNINNVVNKQITGRTDTEYYNDNIEHITEYHKHYRVDNKEHIAERDKQRYNDNKEHKAEQHKQYRLVNKEAIAEKHKQHYISNRERILEHNKQTTICECGLIITKCYKLRHMKSTKHINIINQQLFNNELNHYNF